MKSRIRTTHYGRRGKKWTIHRIQVKTCLKWKTLIWQFDDLEEAKQYQSKLHAVVKGISDFKWFESVDDMNTKVYYTNELKTN